MICSRSSVPVEARHTIPPPIAIHRCAGGSAMIPIKGNSLRSLARTIFGSGWSVCTREADRYACAQAATAEADSHLHPRQRALHGDHGARQVVGLADRDTAGEGEP